MGRPTKPINPNLPEDTRATLEVMRRLLKERGYHQKDLCVPFGDSDAAMSEGNVSKLLAGEQELSLAQIRAFCKFVRISRPAFWALVEKQAVSPLDLEFDAWTQGLTAKEKAALLEYENLRSA